MDRANAAAEAEKTEALSADFTPVPAVMPSANSNSSTPLPQAAHRVQTPKISAAPRHVSATVTIQTIAGTRAVGAHGFSVDREVREIAPGDVGAAGRSPQPEAIRHGRQERDSEGQSQEHRSRCMLDVEQPRLQLHGVPLFLAPQTGAHGPRACGSHVKGPLSAHLQNLTTNEHLR